MSDRWPTYGELPELEAGARSGWHVFGADDQVGLLNLQTAERVVQSASIITSGEVFSLNAEIGLIDPAMFGRNGPRHTVIDEGTGCDFDDVLDDFNPQSSSQWDSLAHVGYAPDAFYNGTTAQQIADGERNTIDHWARRGIVGRGVVIDVEHLYQSRHGRFDPGETTRVTVSDLEQARLHAGIEWRPGDVMILHTGFLAWYVDADEATRQRYGSPDPAALTSVGLDRGPEMLAYLWNSRISAVVADNPAVEAMPFDVRPAARPHGFLHTCLIGQLGMALGELWWLCDLARACRKDGRHEVLLVSAPLHVAGGIGSPANALAIR